MRTLAILLAAFCVAPALIAGPTPGRESTAFEIQRLDRTYENIVDRLDPWQQGALTVHLRSPRHRLVLHGHRVWLRPSTRGHWLASLDLEFEGDGDVIADLELGRISQRLEDHLVVPRQERSLRGEIDLERVEGGIRVTTVRLPSHFEVRVDSRLAEQLVEACGQLAVLPLLPLDCRSFARSLSELHVELPPPGSSYLIPEKEFSSEELSLLEALLAARPPEAPKPLEP